MFADLFYWAFDQVDNAAGLVLDFFKWIFSDLDAFTETFLLLFFIQLFFVSLFSLALSL